MVFAYAVLVCELLRWHSVAATDSCQSNTPVCASDGNTYDNVCLLHQANLVSIDLQVIHSGPCLLSLDYYFSARSDDSESKRLLEPYPTDLQIQPKACPLVYSPVCGTDDKTYGHECILSVNAAYHEALKVKHVGECLKAGETSQESPKLLYRPDLAGSIKHCPPVWAPVCGSDGRVYENKCVLMYKALLEPTLSFEYDGECVDSDEEKNPNQRPNKKKSKKRRHKKEEKQTKFYSYEIHV